MESRRQLLRVFAIAFGLPGTVAVAVAWTEAWPYPLILGGAAALLLLTSAYWAPWVDDLFDEIETRFGRWLPRRRAAVRVLRRAAPLLARADIVYYPPHQWRLAQDVQQLFELAGWSSQLASNPQELPHAIPRDGISVRGVNDTLVRSVRKALRTGGVPEVRSELMPRSFQPGDRKLELGEGSIYVHVGHTRR